MKKGGLKGALKTKSAPKPPEPPLILTPGTFFTNGSTGIGKRGVDLQNCYKGEYNAEGLRHGQGKYTYPNGYCAYEGAYVSGEKHGLGKLTFKDGGCYEGEFVHDEICGHGSRRFASGAVFVGSFELGEMHGPGVLTLANGDRFEGVMDHNRMQGQGTYTYRNGDVYNGDFIDHHMTGQGIMEYTNGDRYEGEWLDGKRHGRGECAYANGDRYAGMWAEGLFNGAGVLQLASTCLTYDGMFLDGKPTQLPSKLNLFWFESEADAKARAAKKPPAKAGANSTEEPPPVLPNTLGTPLAVPLIIAAQLQVPVPPPLEPLQPAPPAAAKPSTPQGKAGTAPPAPPPPPARLITEKPAAGNQWQTSEMEHGRVVNLTLHGAPPRPTTSDQPVGVLLVNTLLPDGSTTLRLLLLPMLVDPPLPITRVQREQGPPERVLGLEVVMQGGRHTWPTLNVGDPLDFDVLQNGAGGSGVAFLVASDRLGQLSPGHCRVFVPDTKAKNPLGAPGKK